MSVTSKNGSAQSGCERYLRSGIQLDQHAGREDGADVWAGVDVVAANRDLAAGGCNLVRPDLVPAEQGLDCGPEIQDVAVHRAVLGELGPEVRGVRGEVELGPVVLRVDLPQVCGDCFRHHACQKDLPVSVVRQALRCGRGCENLETHQLGLPRRQGARRLQKGLEPSLHQESVGGLHSRAREGDGQVLGAVCRGQRQGPADLLPRVQRVHVCHLLENLLRRLYHQGADPADCRQLLQGHRGP